MEKHLWSEYCDEFHQMIEKKGEPLYLKIEVIDAFEFDIFLELRWYEFRHTPILYHSTFGRRQIEFYKFQEYLSARKNGKEISEEEMKQTFPMQHFLRFQFVDKNIFSTVIKTFESVEGTDYVQSRGSVRDGYIVDVYSNIGKGAKFHYWCNLPQEYSQVTEAISLLAEYLPLTDRNCLQGRY